MSDWRERLTRSLEPALKLDDPRPEISAYHNMPYAIFRYPPEDEFAVRDEIRMLQTRLEQAGKRVTMISLTECLAEAIAKDGYSPADLALAEKTAGLETTIDTVHEILQEQSLDDIVASRMPQDADPKRDVVFIVRAGALFPVYRTSSLLEQLMGKVDVPSILFYPGVLDGAAGLQFMGILDAEHNYRPKIY